MPLEIHIQGFDIANLEARMQAMARPAYSAITQHARAGQPVIVFTPTRKHARLTAVDFLTFAAADGQPLRFMQVGFSLPPFLPFLSPLYRDPPPLPFPRLGRTHRCGSCIAQSFHRELCGVTAVPLNEELSG